MRSRFGIFSVLLLLTPLCFSASCRTCKDELCFDENILVTECNRNTPVLPFKAPLHRNREDLQYGCLEVEYLNGNSPSALHQCILTEDIEGFCRSIAKSIHVIQCAVYLPTKNRLKREDFLDEADISTTEFQNSKNISDESSSVVTASIFASDDSNDATSDIPIFTETISELEDLAITEVSNELNINTSETTLSDNLMDFATNHHITMMDHRMDPKYTLATTETPYDFITLEMSNTEQFYLDYFVTTSISELKDLATTEVPNELDINTSNPTISNNFVDFTTNHYTTIAPSNPSEESVATEEEESEMDPKYTLATTETPYDFITLEMSNTEQFYLDYFVTTSISKLKDLATTEVPNELDINTSNPTISNNFVDFTTNHYTTIAPSNPSEESVATEEEESEMDPKYTLATTETPYDFITLEMSNTEQFYLDYFVTTSISKLKDLATTEVPNELDINTSNPTISDNFVDFTTNHYTTIAPSNPSEDSVATEEEESEMDPKYTLATTETPYDFITLEMSNTEQFYLDYFVTTSISELKDLATTEVPNELDINTSNPTISDNFVDFTTNHYTTIAPSNPSEESVATEEEESEMDPKYSLATTETLYDFITLETSDTDQLYLDDLFTTSISMLKDLATTEVPNHHTTIAPSDPSEDSLTTEEEETKTTENLFSGFTDFSSTILPDSYIPEIGNFIIPEFEQELPSDILETTVGSEPENFYEDSDNSGGSGGDETTDSSDTTPAPPRSLNSALAHTSCLYMSISILIGFLLL